MVIVADVSEEFKESIIGKLNDAACKLALPSQGGDKPKDPALYSALKVEQTARRIMEHGDVLKFLVRQAQRNHRGDADVLKHLIASICSTNSLTSAGIQPELNGEKGRGKTDAVRAVFHLIPDKWKLSASISAKALYYYQGLLSGSIVFSDDVEWSDDLIATVKRSMGNFQEPQVHYTLDSQRHPLPATMPARLVWWLSSVESVADDQLKDRQYSLDIDEANDHTAEVSAFLRISRSRKTIRFSVDWRIAVARDILEDIKSHEAFKVVIDCAEKADWKITNDHRTQNKFWDLVEAFAILRYRQRYIDPGWMASCDGRGLPRGSDHFYEAQSQPPNAPYECSSRDRQGCMQAMDRSGRCHSKHHSSKGEQKSTSDFEEFKSYHGKHHVLSF